MFLSALVSEEPSSSNKNKDGLVPKGGIPAGTALRSILVDAPLVILFSLLAVSVLVQQAYLTYVTPIASSLKHGEMENDFYDKFHDEFTYYNRHCDAADITTRSSSDLLIREDYTGEQAADVILEHGAVAFQNVLSNNTASELRNYLVSRHAIQDELGWNEKFWAEQNRLSLGLGVDDHPSIGEALRQIGTHPVVKRSLEGILGPDPAIVELSTLTTLHGADDQGIHSDSDWFGSSLLYSRTFLHSYSFFVALQDTDKNIGATTVCPGTHFCADQDLSEVCLNNGAFEVSTNGHTGEDGLLRKGDAFLFNQNVWHRGPTNQEPLKDRIMFILTFVSRTKDTPGDYRSQALGTYYYQRWNEWSHCFSDLKEAAKTLAQPWSALQALGLWKSSRHVGITWIEQFARQMANGEDFYAEDELSEFHNVLDRLHIPKFLRSKSDEWEDFIPETMALWVTMFALLNAAAVGVYLVIRLLSNHLQTATTEHKSTPSFVKRLFLTHGGVCLVAYTLWYLIGQTQLAQSVKTGQVFVRPFPPVDEDMNTRTGPSTLPERNDVLIGTRFDANFLASFNRWLDFHPGNQSWKNMVAEAARLDPAMQDGAVQNIVKTILEEQEAGVTGRFLHQDPATGVWTVMSEPDALEETRRAVLMARDSNLGGLVKNLDSIVADARFGVARDTAMAKKTPKLVEEWKELLFAIDETTNSTRPQMPVDPTIKATAVDRSLQSPSTDDDVTVEVGDRIRCSYDENENTWMAAKVVEILEDDDECLVQYNDGEYGVVSADDMQKYKPFEEGDAVEVYNEDEEDWYTNGVIINVHPDGKYTVMFDDDIDDIETDIVANYIRHLNAPSVVLGEDPGFAVGDRIQVFFEDYDGWLNGQVTQVNDDGGNVDILYDDGDEGTRVDSKFIRRLV